jgi:tetrahydromethanopterin S-methyltransferase subunit G
LPVIQLTVIELRLNHIDEGQRTFKGEVNQRSTEVGRRTGDFKVDVDKRFNAADKRFDKLEIRIGGTTNHLTKMLSLYTALITLAVVLSQLLIP